MRGTGYPFTPMSWLPVVFSRLVIVDPAAAVPAGWVQMSATMRPNTTAPTAAQNPVTCSTGGYAPLPVLPNPVKCWMAQ
jgi:hypothetical protein